MLDSVSVHRKRIAIFNLAFDKIGTCASLAGSKPHILDSLTAYVGLVLPENVLALIAFVRLSLYCSDGRLKLLK